QKKFQMVNFGPPWLARRNKWDNFPFLGNHSTNRLGFWLHKAMKEEPIEPRDPTKDPS
ncbi:413_t:CDS:2, partial [Racocetra persica]